MNLKAYLNQKASYWACLSDDGYGGHTYADPVEVDVRWTEKYEEFLPSSESKTTQGVEALLSRVVILAETDFEYNGRMCLGSLDELSSDADPDTNNALTIKAFTKIPDKYASQFLRKAWLI